MNSTYAQISFFVLHEVGVISLYLSCIPYFFRLGGLASFPPYVTHTHPDIGSFSHIDNII